MKIQLKNATPYVDAEILGVLDPITALVERQKGPRRFARRPRSPVVVRLLPTLCRGPGPLAHRTLYLGREHLGSIAGEAYTGSAEVWGNRAVLRVPLDFIDAASLAAVWLHELWHLWGVSDHRDYPDAIRFAAIRSVAPVLPATFPVAIFPFQKQVAS